MTDTLLIEIYIFVLAVFVGFEVVSKVPSTLHTPLMSATNAIHGIVLIGAMLVAGAAVQSGECSAGDASGQPHDGLPEMSGFTLNIQAITPGARHFRQHRLGRVGHIHRLSIGSYPASLSTQIARAEVAERLSG